MYTRTGNLELTAINKIYSQENSNNFLKSLVENEDFINIIRISSRSLYSAILTNNNFINDKSIKLSLVKYVLRMSSRSVNFNLFGNIGSEEFNFNVIKVSFSNNWINKLSLLFLKYCNLSVTYNREILSGSEVYNLNAYSIKQNRKVPLKIFKNSILGELVNTFISKKNLSYSDLYDYLTCRIESREKVKNIIKYLIESSILYVDFDWSKMTSVKFNNTAGYEFKYHLEFTTLFELYNEIKYMKKLTEVKVKKIFELEHHMDKVFRNEYQDYRDFSSKLIFETYKKLNHKEIKYNQQVDKIGSLKFLRLLNVLDEWYATIKFYESSLIEKHGKYFEIPFKRLLEKDSILREIIFNKKRIVDQSLRETFNKYLENICVRALALGENINFDNNDIAELSGVLRGVNHTEKNIYSIDVEVKYQLLENNIFLTPISFGFPVHSFTSKYTELKYKQTNSTYAYLNIKTNNNKDIGRNYIESNQIIDFYGFAEKGVTIDELSIGHDDFGIYLKDNLTKEKIIPVFCSLADLNYECENEIALFLQQLGKYILIPPVNFLNYYKINLPVAPRICIDEIILAKKRWLFNDFTSTKNEFFTKLKEFTHLYKVPNNVCLFQDGEEIPIFLNSNYGIDITYKHYCKYNFIIFTEYFYDKFEEEYYTEYINNVNFDGDEYKNKVDKTVMTVENLVINDYETYIIILDEMNTDRNELLSLIYLYLDKHKIDFFFINYFDNESPSIRLRIRKSSENILPNTIFSFLLELQKKHKFKYFYIGEYYNELERYGGGENKDLINKIFELDSKSSLDMLGRETCDVEMILAYIVLFFENFYGSIKTAIESFINYSWNAEDVKKYSRVLREKIDFRSFEIYLKEIELSNNEIFDLVAKLSNIIHLKGFSISRFNYVLHSLVHMSLNRKNILGSEESMILWIVRKILIRIYYTN